MVEAVQLDASGVVEVGGGGRLQDGGGGCVARKDAAGVAGRDLRLGPHQAGRVQPRLALGAQLRRRLRDALRAGGVGGRAEVGG